MMQRKERTRRNRRRAVTAVQVAVVLPVLLGFTALSVDVGAMYNAKAELQRTADAAALAAAAMLSDYRSGDPVSLARQAAIDYANSNTLFGKPIQLDTNVDVVFGRATYDEQANEYTFTPGTPVPDAVQVTCRFTEDSPNGPLPLYFAAVLGRTHTELTAEAIAIMVPRDIAIVADLSGSMNDDCELQTNPLPRCLFDVWAALPADLGKAGIRNGIKPSEPGQPQPTDLQPTNGPGYPGHVEGHPTVNPDPYPVDGVAGPRWGWMGAWGDDMTDGPYYPGNDPGLYYIPRYHDTTDPDVIANLIESGYSPQERAALLSDAYDGNTTYFRNRVKVLLGLAGWDSGMPNGKYPVGKGNGSVIVANSELVHEVEYPFNGSWDGYVNYVTSNSLNKYHVNMKYCFGLKSFTNYLLESRPTHSQTPELNLTPAQPMQAVKDAVSHMMDTLEDLDTDDRVSLEVYGETVHHEQDLTENYHLLTQRLNDMQAGYYDTWTNMGGGISYGTYELTQSGIQRGASRKIMILLTDGRANVTEHGGVGNYSGGRDYALQQAQVAADLGIRIFAVSHGYGADENLMEEIAEIGSGEHFHAEGSIDEYSEQLDEIFRILGGRRPVELIK